MKKYYFSYEYIDYMDAYRIYDKRVPYQTLGYEDNKEAAEEAIESLNEKYN